MTARIAALAFTLVAALGLTVAPAAAVADGPTGATGATVEATGTFETAGAGGGVNDDEWE